MIRESVLKMKWTNRHWIGVILLFFMAITLSLRLVPLLFLKDTGFLYIYDTDSYFTLRQIEVMVNNFPQYNWFDPMTAFPDGKLLDWGPLYPLVAAMLCLVFGATTHNAIVFVAGWVSPLMAVAMVPVMYYLGKIIWDWKAGLAAAGLISVVSLQYFSISSYGWVDHHVAEVLFSTLFFLSYVYTISYVKSHPVDWRSPYTLIFPVALSVLTGVIYFLGLLFSTTVIIVLIVIAIYMLLQNILDYFSEQSADYLLILNIGFLLISTISLFLFGFKQPGVSLIQYSIGIVYVNLLLIAETGVLYTFSRIFQGKKWLYLGSFAVLFGLGFFLIQSVPILQTTISQAQGLLFGFSAYSVGVVETLPLTLPGAWEQFNVALLLAVGGIMVLGYSVVKKKSSQSVFLLVWSVVMLLLAIQFQRIVIYFTVNVVLLSALCIAEPISWREDTLTGYCSAIFSRFFPDSGSPTTADRTQSNNAASKNEPELPRGTKVHPQESGKSRFPVKNKKTAPKRPVKNPLHYTSILKDCVIIIVVILTVVLLYISLSQDISYGLSTPQHQLSPDWVESLEWLQVNTPQTGVDYFKQYEARGFSYPPHAYGIMAIWDAGHWITFIAHRIPITNPFQNNLNGPRGTAAYFITENESIADDILAKFGGRYVITDSTMAVDRFTNLVPWVSGSTDISSYVKWFMVPDRNNPQQLQKIHLYDDAYFQTMVARLHNFDGSMTRPTTGEYVQYNIRYVPAPGEIAGDVHGYARVIASEQERDISRIMNDTVLAKEGKDTTTGRFADIFSDLPNRTLQEIPALKHYRLIHESPDNASVQIFPESGITTLPDIKYVKIFEYVKGAHISGEGIIEVPIVTNTGRIFVYRQASENGEFIVPYSTMGGHYEVNATGQYHIAGTSRYISVTEDEVLKGNLVSG